MAISRERVLPRASNRLATLAQAINNTSPTAYSRISMGLRVSPISCSNSGLAPMPVCEFDLAFSTLRACAMEARSALARTSVGPGLRRAIALIE